jgi:uncharacterized protein YdhG (YjbR/CyaY superfamily)
VLGKKGVESAAMSDDVTAYISAQPEPQSSTLSAMRATIGSLLPHAEECLAYGMPSWRVDGTAVAGIAASKQHCAFFPHSGTALDGLADRLAGYDLAKGTVRFAVDTPLPTPLVRAVIRARLQEASETPDSKGFRRDFYDDGGLKAKGKIRDGELHGAWRWWRKDGSLLRTGSFDRGRQVGEWTTYDRDSAPVKVTQLGT